MKEAPGGWAWLWAGIGLASDLGEPILARRVGGRSGWYRRDHGHHNLTGSPTAHRERHSHLGLQWSAFMPGLDFPSVEESGHTSLLGGVSVSVGPRQAHHCIHSQCGGRVSPVQPQRGACRPPPCMAGAVGMRAGWGLASLLWQIPPLP